MLKANSFCILITSTIYSLSGYVCKFTCINITKSILFGTSHQNMFERASFCTITAKKINSQNYHLKKQSTLSCKLVINKITQSLMIRNKAVLVFIQAQMHFALSAEKNSFSITCYIFAPSACSCNTRPVSYFIFLDFFLRFSGGLGTSSRCTRLQQFQRWSSSFVGWLHIFSYFA